MSRRIYCHISLTVIIIIASTVWSSVYHGWSRRLWKFLSVTTICHWFCGYQQLSLRIWYSSCPFIIVHSPTARQQLTSSRNSVFFVTSYTENSANITWMIGTWPTNSLEAPYWKWSTLQKIFMAEPLTESTPVLHSFSCLIPQMMPLMKYCSYLLLSSSNISLSMLQIVKVQK